MFYHPDTETKIPEGVAFRIGSDQYPSNWLNLSTAKQKKDAGIYDLVTQVVPNHDCDEKTCSAGPIIKIGNVWTETWILNDIPSEVKDNKLSAAKSAKRIQINDWRQQANNTSFSHEGKEIDCDATSRGDIDAVAGSIALTGDFPEGFPGAWKCLDNTYIPIKNTQAFKQMYASMTRRGTANFMKAQQLKAAVDSAQTMAELNAIKWE